MSSSLRTTNPNTELAVSCAVAPVCSGISMKEIALQYLERELTVIPLGGYKEVPPSHFVKRYNTLDEAIAQWPKTPRVRWKEFQERQPTEEEVTGWWDKCPNANIGLVTGLHSGIVVVDADTPEAEQWCRDNLAMTPWQVKTGKGAHFYFRYPSNGELIKNSAGSGLDVRGEGGYVVAPGSVHPSGVAYGWIHKVGITADYVNDLPELTGNELNAIESFSSKSIKAAETTHDVGVRSYGDMRKVPNPPGTPSVEGGRNNAIARYAGRLFNKGHEEEKVFELCMQMNEGNDPPLGENEVLNVVCSIRKTHENSKKVNKKPVPTADVAKLAGWNRQNRPLQLETRLFADIESRPLEWVWRDRIPTKLNILAGNPGCGKSQITVALAATVSTGGRWPDYTPCKKGSVIFICCEDDAADTIKPRLEAAGADCMKVTIVDGVRDKDGKLVGWDLEEGAEQLEILCKKIGDVRLIVIDPITAYVGGKDGHSTSDVRGLLAPLMTLADEFKVAVVAISHLNKSSGAEVMTRVVGSGAYVAASRSAFLVNDHPHEEGAYCMAILKTNVSKEKTAISYKVVGVTTHDGIETSKVEWIPGVLDIDAETLMKPKRSAPDPDVKSAKTDATAFLIETLKDGPVLSKDVYSKAAEENIAEATLKRAKKNLGCRSIKKEGDPRWFMVLPERKQEDQPTHT